MRKSFALLTGLVLMIQGAVPAPMVYAANPVSAGVNIEGAKADSPEVRSIMAMIQDMMEASNSHDLEGVLKHYSPRFVSGDNLTLEEIRNLIEETWETFPDIKYTTQTLEVRINGDWATVEGIDTATANAKLDPAVSDQPGKLESRSRGLMYLHKIGKTWQILSDYTLYERAVIRYGDINALNANLVTPEQVFAGESYSAKVNVNVPEGQLAIATISKEPVVYPQQKPRDRFRSLSSENTDLERIFEANDTHNNEIVTATVGLTEITQNNADRPTIKLNGIVTIVRRVNVIPKSDYDTVTAKEAIVRRSASGEIDLSESDDSAGDDMELTPATTEDSVTPNHE